jgi:two-component system chemotaxis response regulator CheY
MSERALVVDDSAAARFMVSKIMKECGFEVVQASDGQDALRVLASDKDFSIALVDWNMPIMSGIELVASLRSSDNYSGLKIVMVTTEIEMEQVVRALEAGANEYVMKPFNRDVIVDKLRVLGLM